MPARIGEEGELLGAGKIVRVFVDKEKIKPPGRCVIVQVEGEDEQVACYEVSLTAYTTIGLHTTQPRGVFAKVYAETLGPVVVLR